MELIEDGLGGVLAVRPRVRDRIATRLRVDRIDRRLAAGASPEESVQAALRGRALTGPRARRRLACGLDRAIASVGDGSAQPTFVNRGQVREALSELHELRRRLDDDPLPSVRGMARVRLLLTDGTGPLYNRDASFDLRETIRVVLDGFEPR